MDVFEAPSASLPAEAGTVEEITRFVVETAVHAPSVHNSQPWWFSHADLGISVHADPDRRLQVADPDGREMLLSCGAALLTARVALRYLGYVPEVSVLPEPDKPNLVARITWERKAAPAEYERQLFAEVERRRTHRGGFDSDELPAELLAALAAEAAREQATLRVMASEGERAALSAIVEAGDRALRLDGTRAREQAKWAPGPTSQRRDGVRPEAYPARQERTSPEFPSRDFAHGHGWGLPPDPSGPLLRSAGVVCLLTTKTDERHDWIAAGQALQRVLLLATSCGLSAALHSQPLEIPELRQFVHSYLAGQAYPQMILRLGVTSQSALSVRRPVGDVLI